MMPIESVHDTQQVLNVHVSTFLVAGRVNSARLDLSVSNAVASMSFCEPLLRAGRYDSRFSPHLIWVPGHNGGSSLDPLGFLPRWRQVLFMLNSLDMPIVDEAVQYDTSFETCALYEELSILAVGVAERICQFMDAATVSALHMNQENNFKRWELWVRELRLFALGKVV